MRSKIKSTNSPQETSSSPIRVSRKGQEKMAGTRAGTLRDWREASGKSAQASVRRPDAIRDGS
jgi:hypothetical protein